MKILILNASPRGSKSASLKVAKAFTDGICEAVTAEVQTLDLYKMNIGDCRGCLCCWKRGIEKCVLHDDMDTVRESIMNSDIIIESFPLYFFSVPSKLKAMTDRAISMTSAYRGTHGDGINEHFIHSMKDESLYNKKLILVSTCGYEFTDNNYNAVIEQYDRICGKGNYLTVFCPQGGVISEETLAPQVERYLTKFTDAGKEYALNGALSEQTAELLKKPLLRHNAFAAALNRTWDTDSGPYGIPENVDKA